MNTPRVFTKQQQALIEKYRNWNVEDNDWHEYTINDFCEVAKAFGIPTEPDKVEYTGFWSQGDGASWSSSCSFTLADILRDGLDTMTGERAPYGKDPTKFEGVVKAFHDIYAEVFAAVGVALLHRDFMAVLDCYSITVDRSGRHYSHAYTMNVEWELSIEEDEFDQSVDDTPAGFHAAAHTLCDCMEEWLRDTANALYKTLEEEYNYQTSDEAVWDALETNDLTNQLEDEESEEDDQQIAA